MRTANYALDMACRVCGVDGHNSRTCPTAEICPGCGEPVIDEDFDFNGQQWHEACFEVSGGPTYCCGMIYEEGEATCLSCGEPL